MVCVGPRNVRWLLATTGSLWPRINPSAIGEETGGVAVRSVSPTGLSGAVWPSRLLDLSEVEGSALMCTGFSLAVRNWGFDAPFGFRWGAGGTRVRTGCDGWVT